MTAVASTAPVAIRRGGPETAAGGRFRPSAGHDVLLRIVAGRGDDAREALDFFCATFDPRQPVDGGTYRLLPMLFHRMREWEVDHALRPLLKGVYRRSFVANTRLIDGVAPVLTALADRGLAPVLLKGAALAAGGCYPTLATRPMDDVDVFVGRSARSAASAVLDELGWCKVSCFPGQHAGTFQAPSGEATIDIHWHALASVQTATSDQALMADVRPALGLGVAASVPDPTAQLIITLVHGAAPNAEPPVRWVADALLILAGGGVDWGRVTEYARRQHVGVRMRRTLEVLGRFAGDDLLKPVIESMRALPTWPLERWEGRMMDSDHSSLTGRISFSIVAASAENRSATTPSLVTGLLRRYHDTWQVPWMLVPVVGVRKFVDHIRR